MRARLSMRVALSAPGAPDAAQTHPVMSAAVVPEARMRIAAIV